MSDLVVPIPQLKQKDQEAWDGGLYVLEQPLEIHSDPVVLPDGAPFGLENLGKAGFFIYRRLAPGAALEFWNDGQKSWEADPGDAVADHQPTAYAFEATVAAPWRGILAAAAGEDKEGARQFQAGGPLYFLRSYFETALDGAHYTGLSGPTAPIRFVPFLDMARAGFTVGDGQTPLDATEITYFLRNQDHHFIGWVRIENDAEAGKLEIANFDASDDKRARIAFSRDGSITIHSLSGNVNIEAHGDVNIRASGLFFEGRRVLTE
jgi:hypothetical protein